MKKLINVTLKPLMLTLIVLLFLSSTTAYAAKPATPVLIEKEITVTSEGGNFDIGFAQVKFKKNLFGENETLVLNAQIYADNGLVYIEFSPDVESFIKDVKIHTSSYDGLLYDISTKRNINIEIPNQLLKVEHFSRYCFSF